MADPDDNAATATSAHQSPGIAGMIGVDLGAGSGYLIGAAPDKIHNKRANEALAAAERSRISPATVDDARRASTADLNGDGFVTVDEVMAMQKAGLPDNQIIDRLGNTRQVFILTEQQQDYLRDRGVSQQVLDAMLAMNRGFPSPAGATNPATAQGR